MVQSVNVDKLKEISKTSATAEVVTQALANRERDRHFSNLDQTRDNLIRKGERIVDSDYRKYWKDLENAGVGSIVYGRKGKSDQFEWHYSLKNISQSILGNGNAPDLAPMTKPMSKKTQGKRRGPGRPPKNQDKRAEAKKLVRALLKLI